MSSAAVGNFAKPDKPELEDFGEATLVGDNGATNMIRVDCLNRTENAMTQAHAFKAAELCIKAQAAARRLT